MRWGVKPFSGTSATGVHECRGNFHFCTRARRTYTREWDKSGGRATHLYMPVYTYSAHVCERISIYTLGLSRSTREHLPPAGFRHSRAAPLISRVCLPRAHLLSRGSLNLISTLSRVFRNLYPRFFPCRRVPAR